VLILRAVRSEWWIETELQNRFRLEFCFGFRNWGSDDGLPGFSDGEGNRVMDRWAGAAH
jgi:hypothetical protein